jgi:hypothetical protein
MERVVKNNNGSKTKIKKAREEWKCQVRLDMEDKGGSERYETVNS